MQIHWHHMGDLSAQRRSHIEARLRQLAAEHDDLIDVRIGGDGGVEDRFRPRRVRIAAQARRKELVAVREADSMGEAVTEVLCAFERELRKLRERRQRRVSRSTDALRWRDSELQESAELQAH